MNAAAQSSAMGAVSNPVTPQQGPAPTVPEAVPLMVQIAATSDAEEVDVLVGALRMRGYTVTARSDPADNLIHVRIGPFYSRDDADRWRVKLLADGYNAIIQP
jgi:cell division septation protein DedD